MDRLTRILTRLLRGLAGLLARPQREWVHALLAEVDDLPSPWARLAWLGGGLRLAAGSAVVPALAFIVAAAGLVWVGWPGAASNSATPVNRMYVAGILVLMAGLPPLVARYAGAIRPGWAPRAARAGGYAVVLAFIAATVEQQRIGSRLGAYFPVIAPVWVMDAGFLLILAGYVAGLLVLTSRRVRVGRRVMPVALGAGAITAGLLYVLAPFGLNDTAEGASHSLHGGPVVVGDYLVLGCFAAAAVGVPLAVQAVAARLADREPARQGLLATVVAMATAAILVALFTTLTIAARPQHFAAAPAGDGTCPTCEPSTVVVPAQLRGEYAFEAAVNGAGDGALALVVVPLVGTAIGAVRGLSARWRTAG